MQAKKKALIIANLSGFLWKFELHNVCLLQDLGYEVHYASNIFEKGYYFEQGWLDERNIIFHHIDIARSPYMFGMNARALKELVRIIDEEEIELIHCHTPVGGLLGRCAGIMTKAKPKVIYTAHGFHFYKGAPFINNFLYKGVEQLLAPLTDAIVVINKEDYIAAKKMKLRQHGKVYKIPGVGIDYSAFCPGTLAEKLAARMEIGIKPNDFFALSVGELNINKNHKTVIQAIKRLFDEKRVDDSFVYGICGDGFFKEEIKEFVVSQGVKNKVKFFGYQCDIRKFYVAADVTVFPSLREGFGMAGLESLVMGVPVIAADNRGTREYMKNGVNGYVYRANNVEGFADGLAHMYKMSDAERMQISNNCIGTTKGYSYKRVETIMKNVYVDTCKKV